MIPSIVPRVAVDSTIIIIGFLCNILTIVIFCKGKRCPKKDHRAVVLNHCAACILTVIIAALWVLEGSGLYISAHGSEWQCHTIKILYNLAYYIIVYAVVAIVVDQTLTAKYNKAGVSHCKSTAILLSTTWFLAALSSCERLLRTSYKERETQTTSTITPIYNISTIPGVINHPSDNLEDAVIDRYCLPDYETVFGGSGEAAHWFSFSVSLISVLGIAIPSVAICIKAYRNRMEVNCKPDANKVLWMFFTIAIITMTTWMTEELYLLVYAHRNTAEESFTHWYDGFFVVETLFFSNIITPSVVYFIFDKDFRNDLATIGSCGLRCSAAADIKQYHEQDDDRPDTATTSIP